MSLGKIISDLENENEVLKQMLREVTYRSHTRLPEDNQAGEWFDEGITDEFIIRHWSLIEIIEGKLP